jgi:hypothetical protein
MNNARTQEMKHLRSSIESLRRLFERSIIVRDIAEPFASFDDGQSALNVRSFLESKDYDVVGVRRKGMIEGYALRSELAEGKLGDFAKPIGQETHLADSAALLSVFELLRDRTWVLVTILDRVWGIVTLADLHKAPVRMWIFCLISLAEIHTLRIVRNRYPSEEWKDLKYISDPRLEEAQELFDKRKARNEEADLTDCLQLCDKATILCKTGSVLLNLGFQSRGKAKEFFAEVEQLRNPLAHAQDIITNRWPKLADLAIKLENFLKACESLPISVAPVAPGPQ